MEQEKPWWASKGVWGGLIALIAGIASAFGYTLGADDQASIVNAAVTVAGVVGSLLAVYGRVTAKAAIKPASGTPS